MPSVSISVESKAALALARLSEDISTAAMMSRLGCVEVLLEIVRDTPAVGNAGLAVAARIASKTIISQCERGVSDVGDAGDAGEGPFESFV